MYGNYIKTKELDVCCIAGISSYVAVGHDGIVTTEAHAMSSGQGGTTIDNVTAVARTLAGTMHSQSFGQTTTNQDGSATMQSTTTYADGRSLQTQGQTVLSADG